MPVNRILSVHLQTAVLPLRRRRSASWPSLARNTLLECEKRMRWPVPTSWSEHTVGRCALAMICVFVVVCAATVPRLFSLRFFLDEFYWAIFVAAGRSVHRQRAGNAVRVPLVREVETAVCRSTEDRCVTPHFSILHILYLMDVDCFAINSCRVILAL